jgi:hypothetical protein
MLRKYGADLARSLHLQPLPDFRRSPFMRSHIYARAFCRALLEQSGECDAWHTIAAIGERLGIKSDQGFELARECARRSWVERTADSVRLRAEGRRIALQRLSFTRTDR